MSAYDQAYAHPRPQAPNPYPQEAQQVPQPTPQPSQEQITVPPSGQAPAYHPAYGYDPYQPPAPSQQTPVWVDHPPASPQMDPRHAHEPLHVDPTHPSAMSNAQMNGTQANGHQTTSDPAQPSHQTPEYEVASSSTPMPSPATAPEMSHPVTTAATVANVSGADAYGQNDPGHINDGGGNGAAGNVQTGNGGNGNNGGAGNAGDEVSAPNSDNSSDGGKKSGSGAFIALSIVSVLLIAFLAFWIGASIANTIFPSNQETITIEATQPGNFSGYENQDLDKNLANAVAEYAMPSIVSIYTYATPQQTQSYDSLLDLLMGGSSSSSAKEQDAEAEPVMSGLGSGVIIRSDGYIVTNAHVIDGAEKIMVSADGVEYDGEIIGQDSESDIAVVKIDATGLQAIAVANSDKARVGDWVMAIGSPLGYEQSATTGIISALGRSTSMQAQDGALTVYADLLQTDAAINSGNSGGALLDDEGKLLGINTLIASASSTINTGSVGIGFAIPSNYAISIANQIIDEGKVSHAKLGVMLSSAESQDGALVAEITEEDSAAAKAGIQVGDVIISFDGEEITSPTDLVYAVRAHQPGDEVEIVLVRNGQEMTLTAVLEGEEVDTAIIADDKAASDSNGNASGNSDNGAGNEPNGNGTLGHGWKYDGGRSGNGNGNNDGGSSNGTDNGNSNTPRSIDDFFEMWNQMQRR